MAISITQPSYHFRDFPPKWQFRLENFEISRNSAYLWHFDIMKIILDVTVNLCFAIIFRIPVKMTQWCKSSSVKDLSKIRLPDWLRRQWETWRGFLNLLRHAYNGRVIYSVGFFIYGNNHERETYVIVTKVTQRYMWHCHQYDTCYIRETINLCAKKCSKMHLDSLSILLVANSTCNIWNMDGRTVGRDWFGPWSGFLVQDICWSDTWSEIRCQNPCHGPEHVQV